MSINSDEPVIIGEEDSMEELNNNSEEKVLSDSQSESVQSDSSAKNRKLGDQPTFVDRFDIAISETRVDIAETGETMWMWRAKASSGEECVSGTIFDAVMGCIEKVTGGEI